MRSCSRGWYGKPEDNESVLVGIVNRWAKELVGEDETGEGKEFGWYSWTAPFSDGSTGETLMVEAVVR